MDAHVLTYKIVKIFKNLHVTPQTRSNEWIRILSFTALIQMKLMSTYINYFRLQLIKLHKCKQ